MEKPIPLPVWDIRFFPAGFQRKCLDVRLSRLGSDLTLRPNSLHAEVEETEMARPRQPFGPNLRKVLELAPGPLAGALIGSLKGSSGPVVALDEQGDGLGGEHLAALVSALDQDVLKGLEDICRQVIDLSEGKGATSLDTVVDRKMYATDIDEYRAQKDALCRSIWIYTHFHHVFLDAQSFHTARRYRDHGRLYSAFEVAAEVPEAFVAEDVDGEALAGRVSEVLDLNTKTTVATIDLPPTPSHPKSVMVAVRHGGPLSSVLDHRDDGQRETRYYRPGQEAILIYTPSLRKLEVCAQGYGVRDKTSRAFAEMVLGQDLSNKPLTGRNFNLDRFGNSLQLPLPDFTDVEITSAKVIEIETRLGSWKRRLLLQVTADDDIEDFANRFMGTAKVAAARFGYSRVAIAVAYKYREGGEAGTLKLWISSGNTSNVQNDRNPKLRDLGVRLLEFWGLSEPQRLLGEEEIAAYFDGLLFLYDHPEDVVSGAELLKAGIDLQRLLSAQILERKGRQDIVLIEEDGDVVEAEIDTGPRQGTLNLEGPFGEDLGVRCAGDHVEYIIQRRFLSEIVLESLRRELGAPRAAVSTDHIAEFGEVEIGLVTVPAYMVRNLASPKQIILLDLEFRRRHGAGPGLILSAGDTEVRYLGQNVVVPLRQVIAIEGDGIVLDPEALEQAYRSGRMLVSGGDAPQLIMHSARHATLHIPKRPAFNLFGDTKITLFDRLIKASRTGQFDVPTGELMRGMGSKSPQQLFTKSEWQVLRDVYIRSAKPRTWRLCHEEQAS